jgi:hypothetical protein
VNADEFVEAVEFCRSGFAKFKEDSVCDRRKLLNDITLGLPQYDVKYLREEDRFAVFQTCADAYSVLTCGLLGQESGCIDLCYGTMAADGQLYSSDKHSYGVSDEFMGEGAQLLIVVPMLPS